MGSVQQINEHNVQVEYAHCSAQMNIVYNIHIMHNEHNAHVQYTHCSAQMNTVYNIHIVQKMSMVYNIMILECQRTT